VADPATLVPRSSGVIDPGRLRTLPLAPVDGFVLSRIDGTSSVAELAETMGLQIEDVLASLLKLESMGLAILPGPSKPARPPAPAREPPVARTPDPPKQPPPAPRDVAPPPPASSPALAPPPRAGFAAETDVDIDGEHQRQIAELFDRLEAIDHYALLGVPRTADKKAIKRAYFDATSRFHPDRFFRKRLGSSKLKMEAIFGRMTEAHDALTSSERRAEYDAYLGSIEKTRGIEQLLADAMSEMKRAEDATLGVALSSAPPPPSQPASQPPPSSLGPPPPSSAKAFDPPTSPNLGALLADALEGRPPSKPVAPRISVPPIRSEPPGAQGRRDMLARRLTGASMRVPPAPKVPAIAYAKSEDAVGALKRRYEDRVATARTAQARKYSDSGLAARAKGDVVAAANALRVAIGFDPDNAELKAAYEDAQRASDTLLADQYLKQAEYEERSERWADAARSWQRVARARDSDAKAHERGAHCLVRAAGNLHEASTLAQRAVKLAPKNHHYRLTLANVYLAAGLTLNAKRELETAAQLAPNDEHVAALLKRIAKSS
jgi:curved DNA-binding protein CbpA